MIDREYFDHELKKIVKLMNGIDTSMKDCYELKKNLDHKLTKIFDYVQVKMEGENEGETAGEVV